MKKVFIVTDFFMSDSELPEVRTYAFEKEEDAREKFNMLADAILASVEREFNSHSEEDGEADAVYKREENFCESYKDAACLDWWWWTKLEAKNIF